MIELNKIYNEDCLEGSLRIPDGKIDLILTDLPYGNMKNAPSTWDKEKTKWDVAIDPKQIHSVSNRILRKNGKMVLFSQEPYTTRLVTDAVSNVPFSYRMIWEKDSFANALGVNKSPVSYYEDVLVFSKREEDKSGHTLQNYFYEEYKKSGFTVKQICEKLGTSHASHFFTRGRQFRVPNKKYLEMLHDLTGFFDIDYEEIVNAQQENLKLSSENFPSTFNLWEGGKYKSNILKYKKDRTGLHPTQKPILLLEDLIKTYSNEGDTVVDLTCGSGSTAIACLNTNRNFIGFELDEAYFNLANERIANHLTERGD